MPFAKSDRQSRTWREVGPVFGIGRQAFLSGSDEPVSLLDEAGQNVLERLADGTEVEIIAWQPRGMATRYCVRATGRETTGWVGVAQLRAAREQSAPEPTSGRASWIAPRPPRHAEKPPAGASEPHPKRRKKKVSGASR